MAVYQGMEVDKVIDEVASEMADEVADEMANEVAGGPGSEVRGSGRVRGFGRAS